uniref:U4/U6.U5 tri-snRNP-associated protein 1 n=1 Tax=Anthurium amnicola TaxID=1678845 RepID=A0A1D1XKA5_9ARAE
MYKFSMHMQFFLTFDILTSLFTLTEHLAGVKILHGLDKVLEGGTVVLTLKDQDILADGDVNEEADMLENVEIGEQKRRDDAYRASKKRTGLYDDKFSEVADSQKAILPQYDEPTGDEGVTLDESGRFAGEAEKKLEELRRRIQGNGINKNFEDLMSSGKFLSDYYTPEEMLEFKKPKKRKSLRKKEKLDLDALEAEAKSAGLGIGDLGSRNDRNRLSAKEEKEKADAQTRSNAYESAFAKAQEASKVLQQEERDTIKAEEDDSPVFGEDYEDLQRSLEQARKLALSRQVEAAASGPQAIALEVKSKNVDADIHTSGEPQENKVVITEMEEFVLGLQFNEDAHRPESEDVFMDVEEVPKTFVGDEKDEAGGWSELKETTDDEPAVDEEKEDTVQDETTHEVVVGKGLSGALKLLQERGTLKETVEWGGRTMDKKKSKLVGILDNEGSKEIRIERTDEFGRIMTPKEAFRMLSHKFHGKGPGKAKQEKRMKQYEEELKLKQMKASDTPSMSVERMREAQARLKTPYLVLSGHVKPGQTSDPRSGFATVEKDNLGSLTPMLGDRKVEHFLGIKRKNDSSGMGPPPPKKPKS